MFILKCINPSGLKALRMQDKKGERIRRRLWLPEMTTQVPKSSFCGYPRSRGNQAPSVKSEG
jgi:hypothetical protein